MKSDLRTLRAQAVIAALMLLLAALPFVLGHPFAVQSEDPGVLAPVTPSLPGTAQYWVQFGSALVGAIAGASAAFLANYRLQRRAEWRKDMSAGNNALSSVGQMYITFLKVRRMLREEVERRDSEAPEMPLWLTFRPPLHFLSEDLSFKYEELSFLFESRSADVHEELFHLEQAHRDLMGHVRQLRTILVAKQDKAEAAALFNRESARRSEIEAAVGRRLVFEIRGEFETLEEHMRDTGPRYLQVGEKLRAALSQHLGPDGVVVRIQNPADYDPAPVSLSDPPEVDRPRIADYAAPSTIRWPRMQARGDMGPVHRRR